MRGGVFRWARVDRVYVLGGYPVADVTDRNGGVYRAIRFLSLGGGKGLVGSTGARGHAAGEETDLPTGGEAAEVALVFPETMTGQMAQRPWIIAGLMHPDDAGGVTDDTEAPAAGADYTAHHVTDFVVARDTARLAVSEMAGVLLQGLQGQPLRLQVAGEDTVRISSDGEADESVLLGGQLRGYLDGLAAHVEAIRGALVRLENWASSATGANGSVPSYSLWQDPEFVELAPVDPYNGTADTIESAVVQISSKSKGDA